MQQESISLTCAPASSIEPDNVMFTFADGAWSYDCVECKALCCRGHGYLLRGGEELSAHIAHRAAVRLFVSRADKDSLESQYHMRNLPPSCFMLDDAHRCSIHTEYGFARKPETCRLFPFNYLRRIDKYLLVSPHAGLCPLTASPDISSLSEHAHLIATLQMGVAAKVPIVAALAGVPEIAIALERDVTTAVTHSRDVGLAGLLRVQATAASALRVIDVDSDPAQFIQHLRLMLGSWPTNESIEDPNVNRTIRAVLPTIRSWMVFRPAEAGRAKWPVPLERIPHALLTLHVLLALARDAGMRLINYQTVMRLFHNFGAVVAIGAVADRKLAWSRATRPDLRPTDDALETYSLYLRVAKALLGNRHQSIGEVLSGGTGDGTVGRLDRLQRLSRRLIGRLGNPEEETGRRRYPVRRWVLRTTPERVMVQLAARRLGRPVNAEPVFSTAASHDAVL